MKSGFDYREYLKWVKNIGIAKKDFHNWLKQFLLQEAQRVVAKGKPRTPVDTGYLKNSWYIGNQKITQKDKVDSQGNIIYSTKSGRAMKEIDWSKSDIANIKVVGNYLEIEIGLSAEYASYIEYGQRSYQGKYMLKLSIDEVQQQLPARFNREWLLFLKEKGVV